MILLFFCFVLFFNELKINRDLLEVIFSNFKALFIQDINI